MDGIPKPFARVQRVKSVTEECLAHAIDNTCDRCCSRFCTQFLSSGQAVDSEVNSRLISTHGYNRDPEKGLRGREEGRREGEREKEIVSL